MDGVILQQHVMTGFADVGGGAGTDSHVPRLRPVGGAATAAGLARRADNARAVAESLAARGADAVAITVVDNDGIARVKAVPVTGLEQATRWGVSRGPWYGAAMVEETDAGTATVDGLAGDVLLMPDPAALRMAAAQPGWAWAPADQYTRAGRVHGCCQRSFARRMTDLAAVRGLEVRVGSEVGWFLCRDERGEVIPAHDGPGYSLAALAGLGDYVGGLIAALAESGVRVSQLHPGCAPGQLEISLPPAGPVDAADLTVFARHTIRAHSFRCGWRASFSPMVLPGQVGNGGHLHVSIWRGGCNLLAAGNGPYGMTADGESFAAGIVAELPALAAVGAPSAASFLRSHPSKAAVRFTTGMTGAPADSANIEVECVDQAANPYLAIGSVIAAGLAGMERRLTLETSDDAAMRVSQGRPAERLPQSPDEALVALRQSAVIPAAIGQVLYEALAAVHEAASRVFQGKDPETIAAAHRWLY